MEKNIKDSVILQNVIDALGITANKLSTKLKVAHGSIYHILNDINNLSSTMMERIINAYPNVNYNYMQNAQLPIIFSNRDDIQNQMNIFNIPPREGSEFIKIQKMMEIPEQLDRIEGMLEELLNKRRESEN